MATPTVSSVYIHVVEDVISKVRDEFISVGVGENVLNELQGLWELKMMQCGAITGPIDRAALPKAASSGPPPVHDLNVPYEGTEEYETPTAEMLFPPTPLQTPIQTPLPGIENSLYQIPTGSSDFPSTPANDNRAGPDMKNGRPSPYMQPPSPWMQQRPLGVDVNVAYVEGRDEADRGTSQPMTQNSYINVQKYTPFLNLASHVDNGAFLLVELADKPTVGPNAGSKFQDFFMASSGKRKREDYASHFQPGGYIPQQDGAGDAALENFQLESVVVVGFAINVERDINVGKLVFLGLYEFISSTMPTITWATCDMTGSRIKTSILLFTFDSRPKIALNKCSGRTANVEKLPMSQTMTAYQIPQQDGVHDGFDDFFHFPGVANEEYSTPVEHDVNTAHTVATPKPAKSEIGDDDEPPLNEDDDDDDLDDLEQGEEEPSTHHLVLAQFEKVTRTKNRWKCTLKDGIMHIGGKDVLFNKSIRQHQIKPRARAHT
ncbi:hypothetical protein ACLOJK_012702 [Asimina triloba]